VLIADSLRIGLTTGLVCLATNRVTSFTGKSSIGAFCQDE
jgi:hypothetical protein